MSRPCMIASLSGSRTIQHDLSQPFQKGVEKMIAFWEGQLAPVLPNRPDLIVIPEASDRFLNIPGPQRQEYYRVRKNQVRDFWSKIARDNNCLIAYSACRELPDGTWRNSTQIIDRKGQVAGIYNKNHLVIEENTVYGILCGKDAPLIKTDIGTIGCAICFDLNFEPIRKKYEENRPDLLAFCSMYHGGLMQNYWAYACQTYFVGAICGDQSTIINPLGELVAASTNYTPYVCAEINLDCRLVHLDYNGKKLRDLKNKYQRQVVITEPGHLGCVLITSWHEEKSVMDMIYEFEIETWDDYQKRALAHQATCCEP
ncbi:MAG TPA: carbon-nitrogen hydrolase family protein [Lentisphaeria bacterium]|nr:carbon-nitrogen hydrolase family protein [Lentisphaeria bacterium]